MCRVQMNYASMYEVLTRRFERAKAVSENTSDSFQRLPDVIMMDGGRGQVNMALEVLEKLEMSIPVCGMVKDDLFRALFRFGAQTTLNYANILAGIFFHLPVMERLILLDRLIGFDRDGLARLYEHRARLSFALSDADRTARHDDRHIYYRCREAIRSFQLHRAGRHGEGHIFFGIFLRFGQFKLSGLITFQPPNFVTLGFRSYRSP